MLSGLEWEDWEREMDMDGEENGLPEWKRPITGEWAMRGEVAMERRTASLNREPSVFGDGGEEEEVDEEVVVVKVEGDDEGYEGAEY